MRYALSVDTTKKPGTKSDRRSLILERQIGKPAQVMAVTRPLDRSQLGQFAEAEIDRAEITTAPPWRSTSTT